MKILFQILFLFLTISFNAQQRRSADYYAQIPEKIENEKEIRIYKGNGITNSGRIFRIFKENKTWRAELIIWFYPMEISTSEFPSVKPIITSLKSNKSLDVIFVNLQSLNIQFLPKEETFDYKKSKNSVIWDEEEKDWIIKKSVSKIIDGKDYLIKYKSDKVYNEFNYDNPESYLEIYPNIDEYKSLLEILKYIESEFKIKF